MALLRPTIDRTGRGSVRPWMAPEERGFQITRWEVEIRQMPWPRPTVAQAHRLVWRQGDGARRKEHRAREASRRTCTGNDIRQLPRRRNRDPFLWIARPSPAFHRLETRSGPLPKHGAKPCQPSRLNWNWPSGRPFGLPSTATPRHRGRTPRSAGNAVRTRTKP